MLSHVFQAAIIEPAMETLFTSGIVSLYVNDVSPGPYDDFTTAFTEAAFAGYSTVSLGATPTVAPQTDPATGEVVAVVTTPVCTFTLTTDLLAPLTIYGWFFGSGGAPKFYRRFERPITFLRAGDSINFLAAMNLTLDCIH